MRLRIPFISIEIGRDSSTTERLEKIMATQIALAATLAAANTQLIKISGEVQGLVSTVATLTEAVANAGNTTPEVDAAIEELNLRLTAIDALVPDADTPVPTPEPEPSNPDNPEVGQG